jgi:putative ABC transport system permease protein
MTPLRLAWANLVHKRTRTLLAAAGVAFAVTLIFMELGMVGGVGRTATMLYDNLQFDFLLTSSEYLDISRPASFPRGRLAQARVEGVESALPLDFGVAMWRSPARTTLFGRHVPAGEVRSISVVAAPPEVFDRVFTTGPGEVFPSPEAARAAGRRLTRDGAFLMDRLSKPEYGDVKTLERLPPGGSGDEDLVRVNDRQAQVVGEFSLGTGFSWNAMLMAGEGTYADYTYQPASEVTFGLVRLEAGADPAAVRQRLRAALPPDVTIYAREEINAKERDYWMRLTSVGQFLIVAVGLAVVVGVIFVYQMMAADIRNMLPEYATVKALGYRPPYLTGVVLWQAVLLALFGYAPGFVAALAFFYVARNFGGIPAHMTGEIALGVLALACVMCLASGLLAVRKVHTADPADLF